MGATHWTCRRCSGIIFDHDVRGEECPECNQTDETMPASEYHTDNPAYA